MQTPQDVLSYWLDDVGPKGWYRGDEELDADIRDRFLKTWKMAMQGGLGLWLTYPSGVLAYIILLDQFPRNMFRGGGRSFSSDPFALATAKIAIHKGWDLKIDEPARQFFYLPLMHKESLCDQERCVRLIKDKLPETGHSNLLHAKVHREIIRMFGRFPSRNVALGRRSSAEEDAFLASRGYAGLMEKLAPQPELHVHAV